MLEEYIEVLRPFVLDLFKDDSSGHDISHLERTMNIALSLQEKEGGDRIIIGIAAFLHDIHRLMQSKDGNYYLPKESLSKAREILSHIDLTEEQKDMICFAIEHHEEYNWNGNNVSDINTLILQDADNLDAIGAIGIGRTFIYSGAYNLPMYDESIPLNENSNFKESDGNDPTTIHHFYHKLFKLKDNMNTETARKLAEERTNYMIKFVKEFIDEWNGKK